MKTTNNYSLFKRLYKKMTQSYFVHQKSFKVCSNPNCIHNGTPQSINNFYKNKHNRDGYDCRCKDCVKQRHKLYRIHNRDKVLKQCSNAYYKNKEYYSKKHKEYNSLNYMRVKAFNNSLAEFKYWDKRLSKYPEEIYQTRRKTSPFRGRI